MLHWLVKKHKIEEEKKENIHVSYWFCNNRLFKELSGEVLEVEIIYLYFSFLRKQNIYYGLSLLMSQVQD